MNSTKSLWREPMVWLVFGLPAVAVAASFGLLSQALRGGPNDEVIDEVHHTAQLPVTDLGPETRARELGLSATLSIGDHGLEVIPVTGRFERGTTLTLTLAHPVDDDHDQRTVLAPGERGWQGEETVAATNDWIIRLEAADGSWRLRGRLPRGQRSALLTPALPAAP